jgi:Kef-type K+ transport system membrane component KefB
MEHTTRILLEIFLAFAGARLLGRLFQGVKQPAVIGELLAGAILGPFALDLVHHTEFLEALGELGVIMLLFMAGLDTHVQQLSESRSTAAKVAVLGAVLPFAGGLAGGLAFQYATSESLFLGVALMATSVGITVRVLRDLGFHRRRSVTIILGAAVLDDVLGLIALGVVTSIALGEANVLELILLAVEAVVFVVGIGVFGPLVVKRFGDRLAGLSSTAIFEVGVTLMLALSLLANYIGLAAIIGAFLAGLVIAELKQHHEVEAKFAPLAWFFVPFFFVLMGTYIDFTSYAKPLVLLAIAVFTVIAVLTKYAGAIWGARREDRRVAREIAAGMIPRGEVGIVVAGIALAAGALTEDVYAAILGMVLLTTVVSPYLIKAMFKPRSGGGSGPAPASPAEDPATRAAGGTPGPAADGRAG